MPLRGHSTKIRSLWAGMKTPLWVSVLGFRVYGLGSRWQARLKLATAEIASGATGSCTLTLNESGLG